FGATADPTVAERTAKVGLLPGEPTGDLARLTALAELAVTKGAGMPDLPWYQLARGMAAHRDGRNELAAEWLRKSRATTPTDSGDTAAPLSLAVSEHRLGRVEEARRLLDQVRPRLDAVASSGDFGAGWPDWLICQLARREAESLILHTPASPTEP